VRGVRLGILIVILVVGMMGMEDVSGGEKLERDMNTDFLKVPDRLVRLSEHLIKAVIAERMGK
jgi:hypothetical protein